MGIGLTLVQRLVEMHGGRVEVASEGAGRGTQFAIRLPLIAELAHVELPSEPPPSVSRSRAHALRLLVVDDNVEAADSLTRLLRQSGHQAKCAYDGLTALQAAREFRPQAVVLDLGLPGMNGFEVARRLRGESSTADLLLLALSGYGQEEDRRRSTEAGFDRHFNKPLDFHVLLATLAEAFPSTEPALANAQCR